MGQGKKAEAEEVKAQVKAQSDELIAAEAKEKELDEKILKIMMTIPNIIDASVPVGKDDSENVEVERFGEPVVPDFRFRTTRRSWKASTVSIWTLHAALRVTASII